MAIIDLSGNDTGVGVDRVCRESSVIPDIVKPGPCVRTPLKVAENILENEIADDDPK